MNSGMGMDKGMNSGMGTDTVIRQLLEDDATAYRALRLRALREDPEAFGSSYEETERQPLAYFARQLCPHAGAPHDFMLGAFDPTLSGMVGFRREPLLKTWHKGIIVGMYVAREARGRGMGRALLEAAIARAGTAPGLEQITLMVVSSNEAARNLYRARGFRRYGVEPRALKVGKRYLDEDLMVLRL